MSESKADLKTETKEDVTELSDILSTLNLVPIQRSAINYSFITLKKQNSNYMALLQSYYDKLEVKDYSIDEVIKQIQNKSNINIYFKPDKSLSPLYNDTHYRNAFEVKKSSAAAMMYQEIEPYLVRRREWEKNIFNSIYDNTEPINKVKYGLLDLLNNGWFSYGNYNTYGDSYIVLKQNVKKRCTLTTGDSSNCRDIHNFSNIHYFLYCLYSYDPEVFESLFSKSKAQSYKIAQHKYLECQIHGQVKLNEDIEKLVINKKHQSNLVIVDLVEKFKQKNKCEVEWMEIS